MRVSVCISRARVHGARSRPAGLRTQSKCFDVGVSGLPHVCLPQLPLVSAVWLCAFAPASQLECRQAPLPTSPQT